MDPHYIDLVKKWVQIDNVLITNNQDIKKAKDNVAEQIEEKKKIEIDIVQYVQNNNLENMQLKISDGVITFSKRTVQKSMTQKYIKELLQKYEDEHAGVAMSADAVFDYLVDNIEKKVTYEIHRVVKS